MKIFKLLLFIGIIGCFLSCQNTETKLATNPFIHGVASGDPLSNAVIIWTRVTGDSLGVANVKWRIGTDIELKKVIRSGTITTNSSKGHTVKHDVRDLKSNTYYYYQFDFGGFSSPIGRTKTAPKGEIDQVRLAVVSCSNYEAGYFNGYGRLAEKEDIDAVLHLGDYIYEYEPNAYADTTLTRKHEPAAEIITLDDYRTRYAQYRRDADLQRVHQLHPFISIWDDHEIANNAHVEGAQNHNEKGKDEGDYMVRKSAAKQVYYEWMPIREGKHLYRKFEFGDLTTLLMLDERLAGRTPPVSSDNAENYNDKARTMLGEEQANWFINNLESTNAEWKVIGNQVIFANLNIQPITGKERPKNMDAWDGYPAERARLLEAFKEKELTNLVFVSGDTHCSWAIELPSDMNEYDIRTSKGTYGVEFGTPGLTSANLDEYRPKEQVIEVEKAMRRVNPHLKFANLRDQGYFILTMNLFEAKATYYYVDKINEPSKGETKGKTFSTRRGKNQLVMSSN